MENGALKEQFNALGWKPVKAGKTTMVKPQGNSLVFDIGQCLSIL
jgi:hypothetical protein